MKRVLTRHRDRIIGDITGFDRVLFRGILRSTNYCTGFEIFLSTNKAFGLADLAVCRPLSRAPFHHRFFLGLTPEALYSAAPRLKR
jgi:hypothetical protein